jgi:hypothetical protein
MLPIDSYWDYSTIPSASKVPLSEQIDRFEQVLIEDALAEHRERNWRSAAWEFRKEHSTTRFESSGCQLMPSGL